MNKIIFTWIGVLMLAVAACDSNDDLTPSGVREDYFTVSASDTAGNPEAALRYNFYQRTGVHLLFNDTLRHENRGTYADGTPYWFTEVISLGYNIETDESGNVRFDYMEDADKQVAAERVEQYILSHLQGKMLPYSVFLVKDLEVKDYDWDEATNYVGMRCVALDGSKIASLDEDDVEVYSREVIFGMTLDRLKSLQKQNKAVLASFYAFCNDYYDERYSKFDLPTKPTLAQVKKYGFLYVRNRYFREKDDDLEDFLDALVYGDEEEFKEVNTEYPIVIQKYDVLKKLVEELGVKLKVEK